MRTALDVDAVLDLFAKRPTLAVKSDQLAVAMASGDTTAFHDFVLFHRRLAREVSKCLQRWFGMPEEDAEQIGILGLLVAARRFRPELGYQFSTYATHWIKQSCQRNGPPAALPIAIPHYVLWPCFRHALELAKALGGGPDAAIRKHDEFKAADETVGSRWPFYVQSRQIESLAERETWRRAVPLRDPVPDPDAELSREQVATRVRAAVERLHPRYADVLRRRFGIDCEAETLNEIGQSVGLTRERIRQLEAKGLARLRMSLADLVPDWWVGTEDTFDDEPD